MSTALALPSHVHVHAHEAPLVVVLAGEPRGKGRHRSQLVTRGERSFIHNHPDPKTEAYESHLKVAAQAVMVGRPLMAGPLVVAVWAHMGIPASWSGRRRAQALAGQLVPTKKPDFDNLAKVCDALNKVVWIDDAQIVRGFVEKVFSDRPRLVVRVEPWTAPPAGGAQAETLLALGRAA